LVRVLVNDFVREENAKCVLCGAGETAARIYANFGFEFIQKGAKSGPMALIKPGVARSFAELDEKYFAPGLEVKVREGSIADRHDCDRMLDFSKGMRELRKRWHMAFIARQVPSFMDALFCVEDGRGIATVIENSKGSILGYAFLLNLGSEHESNFKVMDLVLHPNYLGQAAFFIGETIQIAHRAGIAEIYSFVAVCDKEKVEALMQAGFREEYRFSGKFRVDQACCDVAMLRLR
jgi:hypothetical protein